MLMCVTQNAHVVGIDDGHDHCVGNALGAFRPCLGGRRGILELENLESQGIVGKNVHYLSDVDYADEKIRLPADNRISMITCSRKKLGHHVPSTSSNEAISRVWYCRFDLTDSVNCTMRPDAADVAVSPFAEYRPTPNTHVLDSDWYDARTSTCPPVSARYSLQMVSHMAVNSFIVSS